PVDCFDEAIRRPGAPRVAVPSHVSFRRLGCLYFGERSSRLHQIADPVSDDRYHVPILDDVQLIAEATVPGDDDRARLARHDGYRGYGQIDETIERRDLALDAAAAFDVDDRKLSRIEHVAGNHDIGSPEEREDVAIAVSRRLAQNFDRLAVQVHVF